MQGVDEEYSDRNDVHTIRMIKGRRGTNGWVDAVNVDLADCEQKRAKNPLTLLGTESQLGQQKQDCVKYGRKTVHPSYLFQ